MRKKNDGSKPTEKRPVYKRKWFVILMAMLVIGTISNLINPPKESSANKPDKPKKVESKEQKPKVDMKTASVDSLTKLYKQQNKGKKKYKIAVDYVPSDGSCIVTIEDKGDYLTTNDFVRKQYSGYINYCKKAYKMSGLTSIQFDVSTTMSDTKGNETMEKVMSIGMKKDVFDTYNWDKVKYDKRTIPTAISTGDFEINYIHPGIDSKLNWQKIYYEG